MELTFVNQYDDTAPKRRRLAKACESCRNRKKRCVHFAGATVQDKAGTQSATEDAQPNGTAKSSKAGGSRVFISDMVPESTFLQRSTPKPEGENRQPNDDIGIWIERREWEALVRQKNAASEETATAIVSQRPHSAVLGPLSNIFFRKIHPLLPLLDEDEFRKDHARGAVPEPLLHAVCVVAAKDPEAGPHLLLNESSTPLAPREFCSRLYASIMNAVRTPARFEKITLVRLLALASLHVEGQDGAEEATMCLVQAMHYTQTLGWHLGQQSGVASGDDLTTKRLFWCLWSLDRLNSCIYGRPIMMSDIDVAIEPFEPGESGFPAFEVWLALSRLLNKVIGFYRPGTDINVTGWEHEFPSFEDVVDEGKGWDQPHSSLMTLHLYYLLVAVLSHRSRGVKYMPRATPSYVRQSLASIELHRLMSSHNFKSLHPLPILPYAISLALSVSYQHLRQARLMHQQEDARQDFGIGCEVLQKLRRTWSSADVIATIARKVLAELNKATDLSTFRVNRFSGGPSSPGICTASLTKPHTIIDTGSEDEAAEGSVNGDHAGASVQLDAPTPDWSGLFEGMDDIFGTFMDPNYPVNLDDFSFVEDPSPVDWNAAPSS
ncbi:transcription factor fungal specific like [Lecanosticta acicola]|uniref:Transcription factor fungal specific like n=1 Tax=Lecanosticta acicola TaxID=111012 RepID=A0AAI9E5Y1_9PEZI|nr:transcription factor fungal specific like [Lecanosticta acicola]